MRSAILAENISNTPGATTNSPAASTSFNRVVAVMDSNQFEPQGTADDPCGALQRGDGYVPVFRIEKATDLAATRFHPLGEPLAGKILRFHRLGNLPCQNFLDCDSPELFQLALLGKEVIEGRELVGRASGPFLS